MPETVTAVEAMEHPSATQPRGERGRFAARPRTVKQQAARLQAAFVHLLTEEDVEAIGRKLIEQARDGDTTSARLVLKYALGELLTHDSADWQLQSEAKAQAQAPRPTEGLPTPEQILAAIQARTQEQLALEADILRMGRGGPTPDRRPGPANAGKPAPPGSASR